MLDSCCCGWATSSFELDRIETHFTAPTTAARARALAAFVDALLVR
jgi:hypothetical protein